MFRHVLVPEDHEYKAQGKVQLYFHTVTQNHTSQSSKQSGDVFHIVADNHPTSTQVHKKLTFRYIKYSDLADRMHELLNKPPWSYLFDNILARYHSTIPGTLVFFNQQFMVPH